MASIEVYQGDITKVEADALVNAANNRFWMGGGVAGALKQAGGPEIEAEAVKQGPVPIGEAVATGAGRLKAKYVIHAAVMGQDLQTDATRIREATRNSLRRAEALGVKSLALPALGTGVGGFPMAECARIIIDEVRRHIAGRTGLERVVFVLYDEPAYRVFRQELEKASF
ncbi:MAG: macro domain-containing protein [Chloroflexi bacterium]|nr:macro domain-containing protein [Chloroflexota bacterium]